MASTMAPVPGASRRGSARVSQARRGRAASPHRRQAPAATAADVRSWIWSSGERGALTASSMPCAAGRRPSECWRHTRTSLATSLNCEPNWRSDVVQHLGQRTDPRARSATVPAVPRTVTRRYPPARRRACVTVRTATASVTRMTAGQSTHLRRVMRAIGRNGPMCGPGGRDLAADAPEPPSVPTPLTDRDEASAQTPAEHHPEC
jgi:hypothetical protein